MSVPDNNESLSRDGFNIIVKYLDDEGPDLSWLGEFRNHTDKRFSLPAYDRATEKVVKDSDELAAVLEEHPHWSPREYRFITAADPNADPQHIAQDAQRLEKYGVDWYCVGVRAEAWKAGVMIATSGGIWGIESDSDDSYFKEMAEEQIADAVDAAKAKMKELCRDADV